MDETLANPSGLGRQPSRPIRASAGDNQRQQLVSTRVFTVSCPACIGAITETKRNIRQLLVEGYDEKKGLTVVISHIAAGRNPKYYDNPMEFRPERWTREFERNLPRGAYVLFAAGPLVCLGTQFAMMEMRMILATLLQRVEPNLADGFEPDFVTELSMHPGERGMQADVHFY